MGKAAGPRRDAPSVPKELMFRILRDDWARARLSCDELRLVLSDDPRLQPFMKIGGEFANEDVPSHYMRDVVLRITKLTDPATTSGRRNASLAQLLPYYTNDQETYRTLEVQIEEASDAAQFARDWRNKHIVHRDYDLAIKVSMGRSTSLPPLDFMQVDAALAAIHAVLKVVQPELANAVLYPPRVDAFVSRLIQLAKVIAYVSDRIGPPDHHPVPDRKRLEDFLKKINGDPTDIYLLYQLRQAARWFQGMAL